MNENLSGPFAFLNHDEDERNIQMETSAQLFKTFKNYL